MDKAALIQEAQRYLIEGIRALANFRATRAKARQAAIDAGTPDDAGELPSDPELIALFDQEADALVAHADALEAKYAAPPAPASE